MSRIYVPSYGPEAWRQFLAKPELQWVKGYSARTLAHSWEAAADDLPIEVRQALGPLVGDVNLLLAIPEHKTVLPGGRRESQSDIFALLRSREHLIAATIEGKVNEPFGPTLAEWLRGASNGKLERLTWIKQILGLHAELDGDIRYQLLHRTAAAAAEADRFNAGVAAMIVHSFSAEARWFEDFSRFAAMFNGKVFGERARLAQLPDGRALALAWAPGDLRFREL